MHPEIDRFAHLDTWLHRRDPRWKLAAFALLVVAIAIDRPEVRHHPVLARDLPSAVVCLGLALLLVASARIPLGFAFRKLRAAAVLFLLVLIVFPLVYSDDPVRVGFLELSRTGLLVATIFLLKAFAILLLMFPALGTTRFELTMKALRRLRVPSPLVEIALFTYRYIFVTFDQHRRMRQAMRTRGFVPRTDLHTLRTLGHHVGILLVGSMERAQRIYDAMKARGYAGEFRTIETFQTRAGDVALLFVSLCVSAGLLFWRFT